MNTVNFKTKLGDSMSDLYNNFQKYFEIVEADTSELLKIVYKMRYQVFCKEHNFLDASRYPDEMEKDNYDDHSSHVLLKFRPTGEYIGSIRLILPDPSQPKKLFPVELHTQPDPMLCKIEALPRQQVAEISRSVVLRGFERRKGDRREPKPEEEIIEEDRRSVNRRSIQGAAGDRRSVDRRATPHLSLILMGAVMRMSIKHGIRHWISAKEPALNRLLGYNGLRFTAIGPSVEYHGKRKPYYANVADMINNMHKYHYDAWQVVTNNGKFKPPHSY